MNLVEKILSRKVGRGVSPGDFITVDVDLVYAHDGTAPLTFQVMRDEICKLDVFDRDKVVLFIDHAAPSPTVPAAETHREMRLLAKELNIKLFDVGYGICHQVIAEEGLARPGMVLVGADSHTVMLGTFTAFAVGVGSTDAAIAMSYGKLWMKVPEVVRINVSGTPPLGVLSKDIALHIIGHVGCDGMNYRAVEFHGDTLRFLSIDARLTLTNMCTEMGAKAALTPTDDTLIQWFNELGVSSVSRLEPDADAKYSDVLEFNVDRLEPQIAAPYNVDNVKSVSELEGVEVDQVFIGSCTNGRYEDLLITAKVLNGRRVNPRTRCIVIPASRRVYMKALRNGVIEELLSAGCIVGPPTCGPCVGAHMGLLASGEVCISTSNRNFMGRMGHRDSKVFLASPATAAASAIEGRITDPRKYLRRGGVV